MSTETPGSDWRARLPKEHTRDDLGNAARLRDHFGLDWIRCLNVDARRCEWIVWLPDRERWVRGEEANALLHAASSELHVRIKYEMDLYATAPQQADPNPRDARQNSEDVEKAKAQRGAWHAFWRRSRNVSMQGAARSQLRALPGVWLPESALDDPLRTAHLLAFADGVYDLRSGQRIRNAPEYFITRYAPVAVDPTMPTPAWDETLRNLASTVEEDGRLVLDPERLAFVERAIGISAFGHPARHVFVLDGPTGTVKSTLAGALQHTLGTLGCGIPTQVLCASASSGGEAPTPFTAALHGRRFAFSQEATGNQVWNAGILKGLTSGERFPARGLYGNPFEFVNTADVWLTTNEKPRVPDADAACLARISVFPCDGPIFPRPADYDPANPKHRMRDATYESRLWAEAPGIAARTLAYAVDAHAHGLELPPCRAVEAARLEYREDSRSQVERFLDEEIAPAGPEASLSCPEVYSRFVDWYRRNCCNGHEVPPQESVTREIGSLFRHQARAGGPFAHVPAAKRTREADGGFGRRWPRIGWR